MIEKKRSVGVWFYGVTFLILGILTALFLCSWIPGIGSELISGELPQDFTILILFIPSLALCLAGIFTLLLQAYILIIIFLFLLVLVSALSLFVTSTSFYFKYSLMCILFFSSAVYFLARPKIKALFSPPKPKT